MANTFRITDYVGEYALAQFVNSLQFTLHSSRKFEKNFTHERYATGDTFNIRLTNNFGVQYGPTTTPQGVTDRTAPLTIELQPQNSLSFTSQELTLDLKKAPRLDIMDMYIKPMVISISNAVDTYGIDKLLTINNFVGTPGTLVNSIDTINFARANLTQRGVPTTDRYCGVDIETSASILNSFKNYFTPNINEGVVKNGYIGDIYGVEFFETQNLAYHTSGIGDGNPPVGGYIGLGTVLAPVASGNTITVTGLPVSTTGVVLAGDIIQLQITQSVNLVTGLPTGSLMSFSVLADADSNLAGEATITVNPSIISDITNPYKNVSGVIGAGESVKLLASHRVGYMLHKDALQMALPMMQNLGAGTETSYARYDEEHSLSMRYTQGSIILNDLNVHRLDVLVGATCLSDYGVRIVG